MGQLPARLGDIGDDARALRPGGAERTPDGEGSGARISRTAGDPSTSADGAAPVDWVPYDQLRVGQLVTVVAQRPDVQGYHAEWPNGTVFPITHQHQSFLAYGARWSVRVRLSTPEEEAAWRLGG